MKPLVYLVRALPGGIPAWLRERVEIRGGAQTAPPRQKLIEEAAGAVVLAPTYLDRVDDALLAALPTVRHVASYGVGVNHLDLEACRRRKVLVTNTPGVLTNATADLAFALLLAAARRVADGDRMIRAGRWRSVAPGDNLGVEVSGKTLGLVGFGRIGQAVARRAAGFSMKVLFATPEEVEFPGAERVSLEELLARSDFVSLHCPLTPQTENLMSRSRLRAMRRGAVLVNTSRGPVVDDAALAEALADGHLSAAGLDVFRDEPNVPKAYLGLENVVLTPHIGSGTHETRQAMARLVWEDIGHFAAGEPPAHPVP
jgi:glyoxylate reductase